MTWSGPVRTARGDLMRARHRLSKLLLRQGFVYSGGHAWTGAHDALATPAPDVELGSAATKMTFESDYDAVLTVKARRDRLDAAIAQMAADCEFTPIVRRLGCLRGIGTLTGFALAVEVGDWDRFTGKTIGSFIGLVPSRVTPQARPGPRARSPRPGTATCGGYWSKPPGTTGPATWSARPCATGGNWPDPQHGPEATKGTGGFTIAGTPCEHGTRRTPSPTSPSPASWPAGAGPWPSSRTSTTSRTT